MLGVIPLFRKDFRMKNPLFSLPKTLGLHTIVTFLVGIGCVYPLSLSLGLTAPVSLHRVLPAGGAPVCSV